MRYDIFLFLILHLSLSFHPLGCWNRIDRQRRKDQITHLGRPDGSSLMPRWAKNDFRDMNSISGSFQQMMARLRDFDRASSNNNSIFIIFSKGKFFFFCKDIREMLSCFYFDVEMEINFMSTAFLLVMEESVLCNSNEIENLFRKQTSKNCVDIIAVFKGQRYFEETNPISFLVRVIFSMIII